MKSVAVGIVLLVALGPHVQAQEPGSARTNRDFDTRAQQSVRRGLAYLAREQNGDGSWNDRVGYSFRGTFYGEDVKSIYATALSGLALAAAGNVPGRGRYGRHIERAVTWLLQQVREDGYISHGGSRMYSHGLATTFLAEMVGMTRREDIKTAVKRAIRLIVESQNEEGGWRHQPMPVDADMAVSSLVIQAMRAARNVGISVPEQTVERAEKFVESCSTSKGYSYMPVYDYDSWSWRVTFAITGAGVASMYNIGRYDTKGVRDALSSLEGQLRSDPPGANHYYYAHFFTAHARYLAGGDEWRNYFSRIKKEIIERQFGEGYWEDDVGINYATSMACLILQMPCERLSIFQK